MRIGIDISQCAFPNTGVANYLSSLVRYITGIDKKNEYILFYSSLRKKFSSATLPINLQQCNNVIVKQYKFPPSLLDILWNKLHILPIEWFIGDLDVFVSSDWTEPPTVKAKKLTILYDLIVYKYPKETAKKIVEVQKRKLAWTNRECNKIICISEATKKDAMEILGIQEDRLSVIYPGV